MVEELDMHAYAKFAREKISAALHNPKLEADLYPVGSWRDHPPTGAMIDWSQPHPPPPGTADDDDERTQASAGKPAEGAIGRPDADEIPEALRAFLGLRDCKDCAAGSNNWVVAGSHTASGKPLLSNDMHLGLTEPNIWFMADLRAPGYHAAGVTLPGMPFVVAGHNEHVAYGVSPRCSPTCRIFTSEKLDGNGNYQAADGSWKPLAVDHELIHVRGGRDVNFDIQSTGHGPLDENALMSKGEGPVALKWTLFDPSLNTFPLYPVNVASNWDEFSAALHLWCWPALNLVYSDDQGHIAYHAIGAVPVRPGGLVGVPIQDAAHEWAGYIPFDEVCPMRLIRLQVFWLRLIPV